MDSEAPPAYDPANFTQLETDMVRRRLPREQHIAIAIYPGVSLLDLGGPLEAFRVASDFGGAHGRRVNYKCSVVSSRRGQVPTAEGVPLVTESIRSLDRTEIDTLIVPDAFLVEDMTRDGELAALRGTR